MCKAEILNKEQRCLNEPAYPCQSQWLQFKPWSPDSSLYHQLEDTHISKGYKQVFNDPVIELIAINCLSLRWSKNRMALCVQMYV